MTNLGPTPEPARPPAAEPKPGQVESDSGLAETIQTPPPPDQETLLTAVPGGDLAQTIKTPPYGTPDPNATMATQAGFSGDNTVATQGPGATSAGGGSTEPQPGEVWGDYRFEELLGRGGMGAVFGGRQISLDRPVAIKILPSHLGASADFRRRFVLEARSVARISSPHVIQVYAAGEHEGSLYFAMEYVKGKDLSARVKAGLHPSPDQCLDLVLQAARGLAAAGDLGIVHRDIKPSNMMVTDDLKLKIMDFGLVKMTKEQSGMTMAGTVMGTVTYFSPEQGRGDPIDHRTDIYALGVVFYELLTGKLPFTGDDPSSVIYQHLHAEPKPPKEINPSIPEGFQAIVLKCMQKDPDDRYPDAHALIVDLESVSQGSEPVTAMLDPSQLRQGATLAKTTEFSSEKKKGGSGALIVLVALAALSVGGWWAYDRYGEQLLGDGSGTGVGTDPSGTDPIPAGAGDLVRAQRLLAQGELDAVAELVSARKAAGELDQEWQAVSNGLRAARANAVVERARSALAVGDGVTAAQAIEQLAAIDSDHAALAQLRAQVAAQSGAKDAIATATTALAEGRAQDAMAALAAVATDGLPDAQRNQVATLTSHARAIGQLLETGIEALRRQDLDTARQAFLDAFQRYENQAASQGLSAVTLTKQFNDALMAGDIASAEARLDEMSALTRFPKLAETRRAQFEVEKQAALVERALQSQDFAAADAALTRLKALDAGNRRIDGLEHEVELQRRVQTFGRALRAEDLDAATAALAAIKAHDGERDAWVKANQQLSASKLQETARSQRLAELAAVVTSRLGDERPDFTAVDQALAAVVAEVGSDHAEVARLRTAVAARRAEVGIAETLAAIDTAVLEGDGARLQQLVADEAHADAFGRLIGQEALELEHRTDTVAVDGDTAVAEVAVRTAMKVYPEATIRYRYRLQRGDDGWRVVAAERLPAQ